MQAKELEKHILFIHTEDMEENQDIINPPMQQSSTPLPQKRHFNMTLVVFVMVALLLLLSAGGYYLFLTQTQRAVKDKAVPPLNNISPTTSPIADSWENWKIYRNDEFGFSLRLPKNWSDYESAMSGKVMHHVCYGVSDNNCIVTIEVLPSNSWQQEKLILDSTIESEDGTKDITLAGTKGLKRDGFFQNDEGPSLKYMVLLNTDNYVYKIWGYKSVTDGPNKTIDTFDQIVSTFQLVDSNPTGNISDWKTYNGSAKNNPKVSYSIKYPTNWILENQNGYTRLTPPKEEDNPNVVFWLDPPERDSPEFTDTKEFSGGTAKYLLKKSYGWAYFDKIGFEFTAPEQEFNEYLPVFDQILSTFKFTETTETNNTANWKTYTNNKIGLSFKYPEKLILKEISNGDMLYSFVLSKNQNGKSQEELSITVTPQRTFSLTELNITKSFKSDTLNPDSQIIYKQTPTLFHGKQANKGAPLGDKPTSIDVPEISLIFNANTYGWTIKYPYTPNDSMYEDILATFKFIE